MNLSLINKLYIFYQIFLNYFNKILSFIIITYNVYLTNFRSLKLYNKSKIKGNLKYKLIFLYNYLLVISFLEPLISLLLYLPFRIFSLINNSNTKNFDISRCQNNLFISKIKYLDISNYFETNGLYVNDCHYFNINKNKIRFESNTLLGFYPHNFLAYGFSFNGILSPYFDNNIKWLVSNILSKKYLYPFSHNLKKNLNIESIDKLKKFMSQGYNIGIIPGGFYDASLTNNNEINCFISVGSIKNCIKYNYNYIPCLTCGEESFYQDFIRINKYLSKDDLKLFYKLNIPTIYLKQKINISGSNQKLITILGNPISCKNKTILKIQKLISQQLTHLHNISKKYFNIKSQINIILEDIIY